MKKFSKFVFVISAVFVALTLSSCYLSIGAFTGTSVKIINDLNDDVEVSYTPGAAWGSEEDELLVVAAGSEAKIKVAEFWPIIFEKVNTSDTDKYASQESHVPYQGKIKLSSLEWTSIKKTYGDDSYEDPYYPYY